MNILMELQKDGRIIYAEISRRTGVASSTVYDKIIRLKEKGIIKAFTVVLDSKKVGFGVVAFVGIETGAELYRKVAEELSRLDGLAEVYGTTGQFDLMTKIRTTSLDALNDILNKLRSVKGIDDIHPVTILETFKEEYTFSLELREDFPKE